VGGSSLAGQAGWVAWDLLTFQWLLSGHFEAVVAGADLLVAGLGDQFGAGCACCALICVWSGAFGAIWMAGEWNTFMVDQNVEVWAGVAHAVIGSVACVAALGAGVWLAVQMIGWSREEAVLASAGAPLGAVDELSVRRA
jgi:hypothetical protein